jgi:hypothetical protein
MLSDSDLRQALLGTWQLVSVLDNGTTVTALGDNPQGYLVYTPDSHVFVQIATRAARSWPGPEVLELSQGANIEALGFVAYCGTFEVRDGQVIHHREFGVFPSISDSVEPRSPTLDGDRLILRTPVGTRPRGNVHLEWQRVHSADAV